MSTASLFQRLLAPALLVLATPVALPSRAAEDCPPPLPTLDAAAMQRIREQAQDHGFLWRISKDGRSSHLYGTMHVGRIAWAAPGPRVAETLRRSDVLALELDVLDPAVTTALLETMRTMASTPASPELQARLQRLAERACLPPVPAGTVPPLIQAMQLTIAEARREGLEAMVAQEIVLGVSARMLGQPVVSLETVAIQFEAMRAFDIERTLDQLEQGGLRPLVRRLAAAWEAGDHETLLDYPRWCECLADARDRESFEQVNDRRNPHLAERIEELHRGGQSVFAAVGALHMTGPKALTHLLVERGFRVERVPLR